MAIYLVRHTAPDIKPGIMYGASNVPVHAAEFNRQMPVIDALLPQDALVFTSPLSRCRRLADFLSMKGSGRTVIIDPRFIERDLGSWTGKQWEDIPRKEAKAFDANYLDHWPPPMMTDDGPVLRGLKQVVDVDGRGGAPLLGVDGVAIICHGRASARAICRAIAVAEEHVAAGLAPALQQAIVAHRSLGPGGGAASPPANPSAESE